MGTESTVNQSADLSKRITFHLDTFREDYEVRNGHGKCLGFIWKYDGKWVCRVGEFDAQFCKTLPEAKELARTLLIETITTGE